MLDLSKMKTLLINLFHEVDSDGNGYLTFDEFQVPRVPHCSPVSFTFVRAQNR